MPAQKNSNWLDRIYEYVAPARAARRYQARRACDLLRAGGFDGARKDRTTAAWNARGGSADLWLQGDADVLRDRARSLIRNNVYAGGALEAIVANVVGCGIIPRPNYDEQSQRKPVQDAWNRWCDTCDVTGQHHFYELQALYLRECVEAGEALVQLAADTSGMRTVPLVLQSIEAERIASEWTYYSRKSKSNTLRRGVEVDGYGRAVNYYLWPTPPNDIAPMTPAEPIAVPAEQILHLFRKVRIGQTRGYTWLAPALMWFRDLGTYVENELMASTISSCFTMFIESMDGNASGAFSMGVPSGASGADGDGNRIERIQPGLVLYGMPGEKATPINPNRPNSASEPWINLLLRSIAVGMGLSYELISRDYSQTNFSSNRASALEDRRRFRPMQQWLVKHLCQPVWREFFEAHVMAGAPGFPDVLEYFANPAEYLDVHWQTPGWEWVDPQKEAQAAKLEVETGLRSRGEVIAATGRDRDEVFAELARENAILAELGVNVEADRPNDQDRMDAEREEEQATASRE